MPGRIKMSAERLAMMSADIRGQLLALQRGAPDGASIQISVGYLIYHPDRECEVGEIDSARTF